MKHPLITANYTIAIPKHKRDPGHTETATHIITMAATETKCCHYIAKGNDK
jgi:hypothetical protein